MQIRPTDSVTYKQYYSQAVRCDVEHSIVRLFLVSGRNSNLIQNVIDPASSFT